MTYACPLGMCCSVFVCLHLRTLGPGGGALVLRGACCVVRDGGVNPSRSSLFFCAFREGGVQVRVGEEDALKATLQRLDARAAAVESCEQAHASIGRRATSSNTPTPLPTLNMGQLARNPCKRAILCHNSCPSSQRTAAM